MAERKDFDRVWDEFSGRIRAHIAARISDQSQVDDILQEVFLKIHLHTGDIKEETRLAGWISAVTNNTVSDFYRKKKVTVTSLSEEPASPQESEGCPACEIAAGLEGMAGSLPPVYAQAIRLVDFEGLSLAQAAARMSVSLSGAKSRVQRARRMIRDSLLRCCHFVFDRYGTIIDYYPACCCCKSSGG
jgi:RNA polymerase sigma-70 factor, ECF subfamily